MQPHRNLGVHNIYPKEMVIKNTNISQSEVNFLDIAIVLKDNKCL